MYNNSSWICNVHHADKHIHKFLNDILVHFAVEYKLLLKSLNNQIKKIHCIYLILNFLWSENGKLLEQYLDREITPQSGC